MGCSRSLLKLPTSSGLKAIDRRKGKSDTGGSQSWLSLIEGSQRWADGMEFVEIAKALGIDVAKLLAEIACKL